ncbi:MAG: hypothetical protein A2281_11215 [Bacteroidetes bacterium RIFOXYA12_FULL_38_20]|nr:MAG: hypothetical protein UR43_C0018G0003 [candidate division TM6 bacterium GW2011_GWF2_33_332]OFY80856.1 MAG: hypothetical protein A2281_11215 [Bacteroidetes bacterium RIFOXYA12_FULL_38_20]
MNEIKTISELYSQIEKIDSIDFWDLIIQINPFEEKVSEELQNIVKTERKVLAFVLNEGELHPKIENVSIDGTKSGYPKIDSFQEFEVDYLKNRLCESNNSFIKSRYSHFLWCFTKNNNYAEIAIESYLMCIDLIINNNAEENKQWRIVELFKCLIILSKKIKLRNTDIKEKMIQMIICENFSKHLRFKLLEIANKSKLFKVSELKFSFAYVNKWVGFEKRHDYFFNKDFLKFILKIAEKSNENVSTYYELLALNEDFVIDEHKSEEDFIRFTSFGDKAKYYKKAGNILKYKESLKEYTRLKNKFKLSHFQAKLPEKETFLLNEYVNKKTDRLLKMPLEGILYYFTNGKDLIIKKDALNSIAEDNLKKSLHHIFSTSVFDINVNHKKITEDEKMEMEIFNAYSFHFNMYVFPLFCKVLAFGLINGKINYYTVFQYLKENSWFGQRFKKRVNENEIDQESSWLSLFAPGLYDFLSQIEWAVIMGNNKIPNYILCIDSMTLKFEGALRDFVILANGTTTIEKRGILQEQLLEELLTNEMTLKYFSEEDLMLFKYVFTAKGWNIRNNVAHCFYPYSNYSFDKAALVFLCILRLGKYKWE